MSQEINKLQYFDEITNSYNDCIDIYNSIKPTNLNKYKLQLTVKMTIRLYTMNLVSVCRANSRKSKRY